MVTYLTEEQELVRKNIHEFAVKHVDPIAAEIDEHSRHPQELFLKLAEGGWMGIPIPERYGGAGSDFLTHVIVVEEISRYCSSTGFTLSFHAGIIGTMLNLVGNEDQKKKYLVPLALGRHLGAFALTEPGAGTDVMAVASAAVRDGDEYVINGSKTFVSNGPLADTYMVFCRTDRTAGRKGMSAFIVPRETEGLKPENISKRWGFAPHRPRKWRSRNVVCPRKTCSGGRERGLPSPWPASSTAGSGLPRKPQDSFRRLSTNRFVTRKRGSSSESPSPANRPLPG